MRMLLSSRLIGSRLVPIFLREERGLLAAATAPAFAKGRYGTGRRAPPTVVQSGNRTICRFVPRAFHGVPFACSDGAFGRLQVGGLGGESAPNYRHGPARTIPSLPVQNKSQARRELQRFPVPGQFSGGHFELNSRCPPGASKDSAIKPLQQTGGFERSGRRDSESSHAVHYSAASFPSGPDDCADCAMENRRSRRLAEATSAWLFGFDARRLVRLTRFGHQK